MISNLFWCPFTLANSGRLAITSFLVSRYAPLFKSGVIGLLFGNACHDVALSTRLSPKKLLLAHKNPSTAMIQVSDHAWYRSRRWRARHSQFSVGAFPKGKLDILSLRRSVRCDGSASDGKDVDARDWRSLTVGAPRKLTTLATVPKHSQVRLNLYGLCHHVKQGIQIPLQGSSHRNSDCLSGLWVP